MKTRNRILYLRQTEEMRATRTVDLLGKQFEVDSDPLLFDQVLDSLHTAVCARLGRSESLAELAQWRMAGGWLCVSCQQLERRRIH